MGGKAVLEFFVYTIGIKWPWGVRTSKRLPVASRWDVFRRRMGWDGEQAFNDTFYC